MTLVGRLGGLILLMLALCLATAGLSVWSVRETARSVERVNLAHGVYERYLSLSNNTYQLFKQYGDALLIGDRDGGIGEQALIGAVRGDIAEIRRIIGLEIQKVGSEEIEELETLAAIERKLEDLVRGFEALIEGGSVETFSTDWARLSHLLDNEIDRDFNALVAAALEEEAEEVTETRIEVEAQILRHQIAAGVFAAISVLAALIALHAVYRLLYLRMKTLLDGVRRFAEGKLDVGIGLKGRDELGEIGCTFDHMAARIRSETQRLSDRNVVLKEAVAERTQRLERLLDDAKRQEANRRRMLSDVSHELRTPLTIIQGEADIALRTREASPETYREALSRARDAARHTARLVDDLLFVARTSEGQPRLRPESVDLATLLHDQATDPRGGIALALGAEQAEIRADEKRLRQLLMILVENARQYGEGTIELGLERSTQGWRVSVADRGPGMSDEEKVNAFERFYRGANAAERYGAGAGLGLPVARAIAEAHGGALTLEDREGGGLVAVLLLPRHPLIRSVS